MFHLVLYALCVAATFAFYYSKSNVEAHNDDSFNSFQRTYLVVYLLAVAGDWLQGPHVYALYESYGMSKHDIELLFVAGFGSSLIFGTVVGSFADKFGRRWNCLLYAILYGLSCVTKHFPSMPILMIGRLLGGIATSILYSAFESWLVFEHHKRGFSDELLGRIFSHGALGNSVVAVISGVCAQFAADTFGFVAPFDLSIIVLVCMSTFLMSSWSENYGDEGASVKESFTTTIQAIRNDKKILCLGLVQSLFEGVMYTFVLEWTPAITQASEIGASTPHGLIFASFMVSAMIGSSLFKLLVKSFKAENILRFVLLVSAMCLSMPLIFPFALPMIFGGFIVFEICVGMFWPGIAYLRGLYVPEAVRSTMTNVFRIPLNVIVIFILLQNLSMHVIFECCVLLLLIGAVSAHFLYSMVSSSGAASIA